MILPALLSIVVSQVGMDAQTFYDDMQKRILAADAMGIRSHYTTGPDSWDSDVDVIFEKPNRFSLNKKNESEHCDGKWYLKTDYGIVTHRPARPTDKIVIRGYESFYRNVTPLSVYGKVEEAKDKIYGRSLWKIKFVRQGQAGELFIDPKTMLPWDTSLIPKGTKSQIDPVPSFRKQRDVLATAASKLKGVQSILLEAEGHAKEGQIRESILLASDGKAFFQAEKLRGAAYKWLSGKKYQWIGSKTIVPSKSLQLYGFESFIGLRLPKVGDDSHIFSTLSSNQWLTEVVAKPSENVRQVWFDEETGLPGGYQILRNRKAIQYVRYVNITLNPSITPLPK